VKRFPHEGSPVATGFQPGGFLERPPAEMAIGSRLGASAGEKPGDRIGRYKLVEQIGEGGCGVVFVAEQEEPVRRRVALKVVKPGMDTKSVIARFAAERQALALMDHPNIAHVFDAGASESGRPYFVMELVEGVKISDYCDRHSLPINARLNLFAQVCDAIQHAHQKGIIHDGGGGSGERFEAQWSGAAKAHSRDARRARLDCDEGAGEGPWATLSNGKRHALTESRDLTKVGFAVEYTNPRTAKSLPKEVTLSKPPARAAPLLRQ
jgi:hypothetical protein